MGGRAGVDVFFEDLDRQGRSAWVPGFAVDHGFKWNREDVATRRWWPQGITTSADASDAEDIGGRKIIATSWYSKKVDGSKQGSRISFVDLHTLRYRHVLLVQPILREGRVDLEPLNVHAGGIVWCGPYLHVAGTARGLFTCRLDDIVRVPDEILDPDADRIGHGASRVATYGYRYLLRVRFSYRAHSDEGFPADALLVPVPGPVRPQASAGGREYGLRQQTTRLASYPLDPGRSTSTPETTGSRGRCFWSPRRKRHAGCGSGGRHLVPHVQPHSVRPRRPVHRQARRIPGSPWRCGSGRRTSPIGRLWTPSGRSPSTRTDGGCTR